MNRLFLFMIFINISFSQANSSVANYGLLNVELRYENNYLDFNEYKLQFFFVRKNGGLSILKSHRFLEGYFFEKPKEGYSLIIKVVVKNKSFFSKKNYYTFIENFNFKYTDFLIMSLRKEKGNYVLSYKNKFKEGGYEIISVDMQLPTRESDNFDEIKPLHNID